MRFAYADPPYYGLAKKFYGHLHPQADDYDRLETHAALIVVSVIEQAFQDIATINPPDVVTDAYRFLTQDQRLCPWCEPVGLLPEFIRELAVKGGYLTAEQVNQK